MSKKFKIAAVVLAAVGIMYSFACSNGESKSEQSREKAYNFSLEDLNGKTYQLSDFKGNVIIVDIWDTWCPPCKAEIPHFIELHHEYKDKGFTMIGVAAGRYGKEAVHQFINERKVPYLNLLATREAFQGFGNIQGIPTTFVIDKKGNIYKKYVGYTSKETFERDIQELLGT